MQTLTFLFAFIAVLALIGVAAWLVRRFANNRLGANTQRGRMPRLAVIDAAAVDGRRRLVLVRRDNVEHLLMIGGPSDIVVEPNIVRAMPNRDQMAPRPAVGEAAAAHRAAARCRLERRGGKSRSVRDRPMLSIIPNRKCRSRRRAPHGPPSPTKSAARAAADAGTSRRSIDGLCAGIDQRSPRTGPAAPDPQRAADATAAARVAQAASP